MILLRSNILRTNNYFTVAYPLIKTVRTDNYIFTIANLLRSILRT